MIDHISIIILNAVPGNDSPLRRRCMLCRVNYPIRHNTVQTIEDLRTRRVLHIIVCNDCLALLDRRDGLNIASGTADMRNILGLEAVARD